MNERIAYLYYQYDDLDEMNKVAPHFNDKIRVVLE